MLLYWDFSTTGESDPSGGPVFPTGQLSCISFPSHEEEFLRNNVGASPYILVLGQDCAARYRLLNCILGERLLPPVHEAGVACEGDEVTVCKRRKLCFTHGRQTRLSLALPGQYELVHQLAANCGRWDTVPLEDLEIHDECEDPAHRLAELEITLHHPLLQVRLPPPGRYTVDYYGSSMKPLSGPELFEIGYKHWKLSWLTR